MKSEHIEDTNLFALTLQAWFRNLSRNRAQRTTFERRVFWCIEFDPEVFHESSGVLRRQSVRRELPKAKAMPVNVHLQKA